MTSGRRFAASGMSPLPPFRRASTSRACMYTDINMEGTRLGYVERRFAPLGGSFVCSSRSVERSVTPRPTSHPVRTPLRRPPARTPAHIALYIYSSHVTSRDLGRCVRATHTHLTGVWTRCGLNTTTQGVRSAPRSARGAPIPAPNVTPHPSAREIGYHVIVQTLPVHVISCLARDPGGSCWCLRARGAQE